MRLGYSEYLTIRIFDILKPQNLVIYAKFSTNLSQVHHCWRFATSFTETELASHKRFGRIPLIEMWKIYHKPRLLNLYLAMHCFGITLSEIIHIFGQKVMFIEMKDILKDKYPTLGPKTITIVHYVHKCNVMYTQFCARCWNFLWCNLFFNAFAIDLNFHGTKQVTKICALLKLKVWLCYLAF